VAYDLAQLKELIPPTAVLDHFGHAYTVRGKIASGLCPFHDERTPSFIATDARGTFHCFGCNEHGDSINLWAQLAGIEKGAAIREMASHLGLAPDQTSPDVALTRRIARELIRERAAAASNRERLRLNALAVRAYHSERAEGLFREAARLVGHGDAGLEYARRAQECAEAKEEADRGLDAHSERA